MKRVLQVMKKGLRDKTSHAGGQQDSGMMQVFKSESRILAESKYPVKLVYLRDKDLRRKIFNKVINYCAVFSSGRII
jgi:hypothetical protein